MTEVEHLIEIISDELFRQSTAHSDVANAPSVWNGYSSPDFIGIDGTVNLRKLAMAIITRRCT